MAAAAAIPARAASTVNRSLPAQAQKKRKTAAAGASAALAFLSPGLDLEQTAEYTQWVQSDPRWRANTDLDADVVLKVSHVDSFSADFYCHSTLLKMASVVWKDALQGAKDEEAKLHVIEVTDTHPWVMAILLECVYPQYHRVLDTLPKPALRDLLQLAWRYDVQSVVQQLSVWCSAHSDFRTCLLVDQLTGKHDVKMWTSAVYASLLDAIYNECKAPEPAAATPGRTTQRSRALVVQNALDQMSPAVQAVILGALLDIAGTARAKELVQKKLFFDFACRPHCGP